jgi:hypothetical protein
MILKTSFLALAALAFLALPLPAAAADTSATKPGHARIHKKSCFDAAWGSPEWQACEARMHAQGPRKTQAPRKKS